MQAATFVLDNVDHIDLDFVPDLAFYFADRDRLTEVHGFCTAMAPQAIVAGCSSGGQFANDDLSDGKSVCAFLRFDNAEVRAASQQVFRFSDSRDAGRSLGADLSGDALAGVIVLSDGTSVNGSEIAAGLSDQVGSGVPVVGGLAGDGADFHKTLVGLGDDVREGLVVAIGIYGHAVKFGHGSQGGWSAMGPRRTITRSSGNELFEFDGKPALQLYEKYLGEEAENLPSSALLFPLEVTPPGGDRAPVVRTVLNVDRDRQTMTFAGNIEEGATAQMMQASLESLIEGAAQAAEQADISNPNGSFALLVSCIGRKLLMGQRAEEDVEAVSERLGRAMPFIGFYSYGEICPSERGGFSHLHNQTMTVTVISEQTTNDRHQTH